MACSSDVVRKVLRLKLQLTATGDSATVMKNLQKLKDLDITLDVLAETGIGKTVNSLRRHKQAGEYAKSLVKGWKKLIPNEPTSHTDDRNVSESLYVKDKLDDKTNSSSRGSLTMEDLNNNSLTSHSITQDSSDEPLFQTGDRKDDSAMQHCVGQKRKRDQTENEEISQQENDLKKKIHTQEKKMDVSVFSKKKKNVDSDKKSGDVETLLRLKNSSEEDTPQKPRCDSTEKIKSISDSGGLWSEKESNKKEASKQDKESFSFESRQEDSNMFKVANVKDQRSSQMSKSSKAQNRNGDKSGKETREHKQESENRKHLKHKRAKTKHRDREHDREEPSMSFESYLNYDVNVFKRKERCGTKKPPKKVKNCAKVETTKNPGMESFQSPVMSINVTSMTEKSQKSVMDLMSIPLPAVLPECENPIIVEYCEKRVEKESEFCEVSEESAVFTGQRLNRKMQVYSGAKTIFLPTMMSLYQQCIRTLQNNINLLYETGGVPFEILEPVLERCTPEQLLRIEECNPIYIGVTDHLWGIHCQRDFKDSKLQEYESWKEMYIRLSEERERKLQRLTKTIVSAHSQKPKGRQVKMAFIHTVAKPPRDVRIQQEIHGTAVQQPHQLRCSVKVQENRSKQSCNEPSRPSSTSSGASNIQDPRKKTRVAPMMAKSLKAFKKQLGRR